SATHTHPNLPGMVIPEAISYTKSIETICQEKDILLFAVPSPFVRSTAEKVKPFLSPDTLIADVAKGIEPDTLLTMSEVILSVLGDAFSVVALTGPTHAEEVALSMPTTIVASSYNAEAAEAIQSIFDGTCIRAYTNPDPKGSELCGALKNVIALAAGISDGIGYGDNAKAALITRGMAEITRLGLAMGCDTRTFYGLAGIGDLIVTATSPHSRNGKAGRLIGGGATVEEALTQVGMVVEGVNALPAAMALSRQYGVELPIIRAVHTVIEEGADPLACVKALMTRTKKSEF
ncbi:MAG: NAD(P)-dependent glycerol-3-phosphate dehydrogenase, partial [Clostridia bacterium]|nr:NAD(P)-dependent glycerol-3-phosphate dehydrogenase [Clostridia bacterium]